MRILGFSLIELMVVVAIIGLLAAVAVPVYQEYIIRSKISTQIPTLVAITDAVKLGYNTQGAVPSSVLIEGQTIPLTSGWHTVNIGNIIYIAPGSGSNWFIFIAAISGLEGIPGYVDPATSGSEGNSRYSELSFGIIFNDATGVTETRCGPQQGYPSQSIPAQYLPIDCTCQNVNNWVRGGSC